VEDISAASETEGKQCCTETHSITPVASAFACDGGHWVDQVSGQGRIVILEDRSVWAIDDGDEVDTALRLPATDITACSNKLYQH
jgi:hypothetical protein